MAFTPHSPLSNGQSKLYVGGGTTNALLTKATSALLVADVVSEVLDCGEFTRLDIDLMASAANKSCTLAVWELDMVTSGKATVDPVVAQVRRVQEFAVGHGDLRCTIDRAAWGLTTATENNLKPTIPVFIRKGSKVKITVAATDGSVSWYARVAASTAAPGEAMVAELLRAIQPPNGSLGAITPGVTVFAAPLKELFVGTGGNVTVTLEGGQSHTFTGVLSGTTLVGPFKAVTAATADNLSGRT